jgi:hypothetical protein
MLSGSTALPHPMKGNEMKDIPTTEEPVVYHNAESDREEAIRRYGIGHVRAVEDLDRITEACYGPRYRGQLR